MFGKNGGIASDERKKAKNHPLKLLASLFLILTVLIVPVRGALLIQDYNHTVHQNQVLQYGQQNSGNDSRYQSLLRDYRRLQQENTALKDNYAELQQNLSASELKDRQLSSNYSQLETTNQGSNSKLSAVQNSSVSAPFVAISDRVVHVAFHKLDGSLIQWAIPFTSFETEMARANQVRTGLFGMGMPTVILKEESGKELLVGDFRSFIDMAAFKDVMASLYEQSPDDYTFIKEVWNLVGQLVQYQSEKGEIPRFPLETLVGGAGDCEDYAILFASLIEAAPVKWKVDFVYLNSNSPLDPKGISDHVIIYIDTGNEKHYIETTSRQTMEPYTKGVAGWYLPVE